MDRTTADNIFHLIAKLTDEDMNTSALHDTLNSISSVILEDFSKLVDRTTYANKYVVYEKMQNLLASVQLYTYVPQLINKHVVGCPYTRSGALDFPQAVALKLPESLSYNGHFLSRSIPTVITNASTAGRARVLNTSNSVIPLSDEEYRTFLECDYASQKDARVNLTSAVSLAILSSTMVPPAQAILFLPDLQGNRSHWYHALLHSVDTLMIPSGQEKSDSVKHLIENGNIKCLLLTGRGTPANSSVSGGHFHVEIKPADSYKIPDLSSRKFANFQCDSVFFAILTEFLWHFGEEAAQYQRRLRIYNEDVMYLSQDDEAQKVLQEDRSDVKHKYEDMEALAKEFLLLGEAFRTLFSKLQSQLGGTEASSAYDNHSLSPEDLMSSMYRLSVFCKEISSEAQLNAKDGLKQLSRICREHANAAIANVIMSDYQKAAPALQEIKVLGNCHVSDPFLKKMLICHADTLLLSELACGAIVDEIRKKIPISASEHRLLANYLMSSGRREEAKAELLTALRSGDLEAGAIWVRAFSLSEEELKEAARYGVSSSAIKLGTLQLERYEQGIDRSKESFESASKYLNVAASMKEPYAFVLLGRLWYSRASFAKELADVNRYLEIAFQHYREGEETPLGLERMGVILYRQSKFRQAMSYLTKVDSAKSHFLRGSIYEKGLGVAKNINMARQEYQRAANMGDTKSAERLKFLVIP